MSKKKELIKIKKPKNLKLFLEKKELLNQIDKKLGY